MPKHRKTVADILRNLRNFLFHTFPADRIDPVSHTMNGSDHEYGHRMPELKERTAMFRKNNATLISSFLGLPNAKIDRYEQSFLNIGKNFIGWQPNKSTARLVFNAVFMIPLNTVLTPLKFALNVMKLFTEVAPVVIQNLFAYLAEKAIRLSRYLVNRSALLLPLAAISFVTWMAFVGATYYFGALHIIGRSLTSPIDSIRDTWHSNTKTWTRFLYTTLHIILIANVYAVALPVAIAWLPAVLPVLTPAVTAIINGSLSAGLLIGAGFATIGVLGNLLVNRFRNWWHSNTAVSDIEPDNELPSSEIENNYHQPSHQSQHHGHEHHFTMGRDPSTPDFVPGYPAPLTMLNTSAPQEPVTVASVSQSQPPFHGSGLFHPAYSNPGSGAPGANPMSDAFDYVNQAQPPAQPR
ncbi:hypothetical protein ACFORL_10495 [Legionella dresdenensis]|uniref:Uncharacterized protein n=1 Tax=Legionella dresdenensis TaxID=450200 RepID=A0ABV8CGZ5_9GAMM